MKAKVIDDLAIPAPPPSIPVSKLRIVPPSTYRVLGLKPPPADPEKLKKKLEAQGYTGTIKFSSQEAANLYDVFLSLEQNTLGLDVGADLDILFATTADYTEHLASTSGTYFLPRTMDHLNANGVRAHTSTTSGAWELEKNGVPLSGAGVTIAIIDVGFASGNYDITGYDPVRRLYPGTNRNPAEYDFVQDDRNVDHADCYESRCWHGTHSAAMAAGGRNNHYGTAGVAPQATLLLFRVGTGKIDYSHAGEAVRTAIAWGADVISMSFGGWYMSCNDYGAYFNDALKDAESAGIVSVAGAGNDNTATGKSCGTFERMYLPGAWSQVITVGAHDRAKNRSIWNASLNSASNYGPIAQVWAPGGGGNSRSYGRKDLPSTPTPSDSCYATDRCLNDPTSNSNLEYDYAGTSAATPIVAGTVALMKQYRPSLTKTQALSILQATAGSSSDSTVSDVVNAEAALRYMGAR